MSIDQNQLRLLPSIDELLQSSGGAGLIAQYSRSMTLRAIRAALAQARLDIFNGSTCPSSEQLLAAAEQTLQLAMGREVIISRGQLVEIGGGFRVPDVMRQSGCLLVEVGTTNRTRVGDYEAALSERSAVLLTVHPSNFVISGFTESTPVAALAE